MGGLRVSDTSCELGDRTIVSRIAQWARSMPDATAFTLLRSDGSVREALTFGQLWARSMSLAQGLADFVAPGDRAILAFDSQREFIEAFVACQIAGIVAVPASLPRFRQGGDRLASITRHAGARAILTGLDTVDVLEGALTSDIRALATPHIHSSQHRHFAPAEPGAAAMIQYSSGSTGAPKGVVLTHENLMHNQALIQSAFRHDASTVFAGVLPLFHDMGLIGNVLQPLYLGIQCVLISPASFLKRPVCWLEAISRYGVTTTGGPNFLFDVCVDRIARQDLAGLDLSAWSVAFNGADYVNASTLDRFTERFAEHGFRRSAFAPCYGLAEATLLVSGGRRAHNAQPMVRVVDRDALRLHRIAEPGPARVRLVSCGLPAAEDSVRIVDREALHALGPGQIGEIWVRSQSVGRGYWQSSDTDETFEGRLRGESHAYLRTGDLGFLDADGELFVTGRCKDLIVVHGQNIYPHDLEAAIVSDTRLASAAAFQVHQEQSRLVLLVEPIKAASRELADPNAAARMFATVRKEIYRAHGIAVDDVALVPPGSLPRTTSGKLRRAAAAAAWQTGTLAVLAREQTSVAQPGGHGAAGIIARTLGIDERELASSLPLVNRGVDSLRAAALAGALEVHGILCPAAVLLAGATLQEIEAACSPIDRSAPAVDAEQLCVPLGAWQQPFWFAQIARPESGANNVKLAVRVRGELDATRWSDSVGAVVRRHESLRVTIRGGATAIPTQMIGAGDVSASFVDAADWTEEQIAHHVTSLVNAPFDLQRGPMVRSAVIRTRDDHVVVFAGHHVVLDLSSVATILEEVIAEYRDEAGARTSPALGLAELTAKHEAALARGHAADIAYWREVLSGDYEVLQLPLDRPRRRNASETGARIAFEVDGTIVVSLRSLCARAGVTLHTALLAAYRVLLYRYTSQPDVLVGTPLSRRVGATERFVGCLVNPAAIRCRVDGASTFADVLAGVRHAMLGALRHGDAPFHEVVRAVRAVGSDAPLVQTMFALQQVPAMPAVAPLIAGIPADPLRVGELELVGYPLRSVETPFDLGLVLAEQRDRLCGYFEYRTAVLNEPTVERFVRHYCRILQEVLDRPDAPIACVDMLDDGDRGTLERFQRGNRELPPLPRAVHWLFREQAQRTPDAIAVRCHDEEITYRDLAQRVRDVAAGLQARGIAREHRIGIATPPSLDWIVAMLAVWQAGGAVVPLDVAAPPQRLRDMLQSTTPVMIVCDGPARASVEAAIRDLLPAAPPRVLDVDGLIAPAAELAVADDDELAPQSLAYITFTSGSAGKPKGVMITHEGAANFALAQAARLERSALRRVLQLAPPTFDAAFSDVFMSLATGGTLCIAPPSARIPGRELARFLRAAKITLLTATPSVLATLEPEGFPDLEAVISMGETCTADAATRWSRSCVFYNGYGPTEASIGATLAAFDSDTTASPREPSIGVPFANYDIYVLGSDLEAVPAGVPGEIFIGGPGVARGYVDQPDWTAERFLPNPFARAGARMYRTGDRGRWLPGGGLEFLGRVDRQIKLRGVRIEPSELESSLRAHPSVRDCYVDMVRDGERQQLVAFVVGPEPNETRELVTWLRGRFPSFMIPARFVCLDHIPVRQSGKVDRDKLALADIATPAMPASDDIHERLRSAWSDVLGVPIKSIDDNFFDLGGHSLLLHRLQIAVEARTGCTVEVLDFFEYPTIRALALRIDGAAHRRADTARSQPTLHGDGRPPIAIIGIAARFPDAPDLESYWRDIVDGREAITFFSPDELAAAGVHAPDESFVPARGIIDGIEDFDPDFFGFSQREAEILDPQKRALLELAQQAFDDAAYAPSDRPEHRDVGVFVGTSRNTYFANNVATHRELVRSLGHLKIGIASDPGFAATLIAYKLNLTGPCLNVDTACSTSLVAVHQACQSLWAQECRLALAGGASIDVPIVGGHYFEEGLIASRDGHCRAFDDRAGGTVKGMGAGLVLLKRLDAAVQDGDHIYAVIRASAINNDGARKIGFTAPSAEGQERVIRGALAAAGVAPSTLGYIEAHGTGTALGDPIEIAALNRALQGAAAGTIAIGSVKSNIGHLDAAAGIAGLIKCALVVSRGVIPPQVHLQVPNPKIDWSAGPLYVPTGARAWPATAAPRRAGVSSFGIGGTNAHVVLEAPPQVPVPSVSDRPCLVALSAGSTVSLRETARRLADAVRDPRTSLADVAFTFAAGRRQLAWRTSLVCATLDELVEQLDRGTWEPVAATEYSAVVVAFPDSADIDGEALSQLIRDVPAFASAFAECRTFLDPPRFQHAATFAIEYALWSTLRAAGVRAQALVGQGIGELVALCAADGISLEEALDLASEWGRLAASSNTAASPIGARLAEHAARLAWRQPQLPVCSAATAEWLRVPGPAHWTNVACGEQALETALVRAAGSSGAVAIDVGPSPVLLSSLRRHPSFGPSGAHSLACSSSAEHATAHLLATLGRLWEIGATVDLARVVAPARRTSLPGVSFDRSRCWLEPAAQPVVFELAAPAAHADTAQHVVAELWTKFLGASSPVPEDNFFALGGDSLLALELTSELAARTGVTLSAQSLFECPTFGALCDLIAMASSPDDAAAPLPATLDAAERIQLSAQQRGLWLATEIEGAGASMNLSVGIRFDGPVDAGQLQTALRALLARHPILLHDFELGEAGPVQWRAHDPDELVLAVESADPAAWDDIAQQQANAPFAISGDLLVRATLLCGTRGDAMLIVTVHHLIADGWSLLVLLRDLARLYDEPATALPAAASYRDHAAASATAARPTTTERLRDLPVVELPPDRPRPRAADDSARSFSRTLDTPLSERIRAACRDHNRTLFGHLLAAFEILVRRFVETDEVVVASPIMTRTAVEHRDMVGPFVSLMVFRDAVHLEDSFADVAVRVRDAVASALDPCASPLEEIIADLGVARASRAESPFRLAFALNLAARSPVRFGPATVAQPVTLERRRARHRLMLWIDEIGPDLRCTFEYRTAYYDETTIRRYANAFERVLDAVTRDPHVRIDSIELLDDDDRRSIARWNATAVETTRWSFVQQEISRVAAATPAACALACEGRTVDYRTLDAEARRIARLLLHHGVTVEKAVGVYFDRGIESVTAALGVLYAGGCYVPLDPELPEFRLQQMIRSSGVRSVLTDRAVPDALHGVVRIGFADSPGSDLSGIELPVAVHPRNLAYVLFTSGSTGVPKGVMVDHRALANRLDWMIRTLGFGSTDRILHKTPASFDVSVWEILATLAAGSTMVIARPGGHRDAAYIASVMGTERVTIVHFVPSMLQVFLEQSLPTMPWLRYLVCSGEVLPTDLYERASAWLADHRKTINLYGPTEAAIDVTAWINEAGEHDVSVSIGRPIENIRIHILDRRLETVPVGMVGDLYIEGIGLARGYIAAPHLTADRFVPDPFGSGGVLYRTGDRARWTVSGNIEYCGRDDAQIKVRGMRVDLGEIESALRTSPLIDAVAVTVHGGGERQRLIAHVVPRRDAHPDLADELRAASAGGDRTQALAADARVLKARLRAHAASQLAGYMVPHDVVLVARLPVTASGKLDRVALPSVDPWSEHGSVRTSPSKPLELVLAGMWQEVLGEPPWLEADFFESGGNSLLAVRLVTAIETQLGMRATVEDVLQHPTFGALAARLETAAPVAERLQIVARPADRFEPFPMTELQQAYAIGRSTAFQLGNVSTHGYLELVASGIERQRVTTTLNKLIARHDMLRATVCGEGSLQVRANVAWYEPAYADLRSYSRNEADAAIERIRFEMSNVIFDLTSWPLFDIRLTQTADDQWIVHVAIDALVVDAASALVLEREFNRLYTDEGDAPLLDMTYRDFAVARAAQHAGEAHRKARSYWLGRLDAMPEAPKLPLRASHASIKTPRFSRTRAVLEREAWLAIQQGAEARGVTPASIVIAAYAETLARWSGDEHFLVNLPIMNRPPGPAFHDVVGNFTSTLLLEVDLREAGSFTRSVQRVHRQLWSDLVHLAFDGVEVQRARARRRRTLAEARTPIVFTGLFGLHHASGAGERPFDLAREVAGVSRTSQVLLDCIAVDRPDGLILNWDHVAEAFGDGMIGDMLDAFVRRLRAIARDDAAWEAPMSTAPPAWRADQIVLAPRDFEPATLIEHVLDASHQFAKRVALVSRDTELSYADVRALAGGVAARLREAGMRRGDVVAILSVKGWEQVVAALGIWLAGGAYAPVDAKLPAERRGQILEDSGARFVVTQPDLAAQVGSELACVVVTPEGPRDTHVVEDVGPNDLAYVIFTSGSTGRPKGVAIEHGAAANTVLDINRRFALTEDDAVLCVSALDFDLSVYDMFGLLIAGGRLVFPDADALLDAEHWWQLIARQRVTVWNTTPLLATHLLTRLPPARPPGSTLRLCLLSGDWIPLELPDQMREAAPGVEVISLGGATEASIWSIYYPVGAIEPEWKSIPYGRPLAGQDVVVLDRNLEHCPTWVTGDIYIAGVGLARGYLNQPELTAKAFITHPTWGARLYRTGDLGRYLPDGNIEFLGRSDDQVKLQGVRLELGEVESHLEARAGIDRAVVLADRTGRGVQRLVAYVALARDASRAGVARTLEADPDACYLRWQAMLAAVPEQPQADPEAIRSVIHTLESQYRASIGKLFAGFEVCARPKHRFTVDDLLHENGIASRYRRWLSRALSYLTRAGCLARQAGDTYEVVADLGKLVPVSATTPDVPLVEVLREEVHSAQLYADAGTAASYQTYYQACHRIASGIMAERARAASDRPLRVLEVGAGYGSLTEHLLPVLRAHDRYVFTDVSSFFLSRAEERFARYGFVTFDHFDIDVDPQLQGYERHGYDVVIAASVLHNARDLPSTLAKLSSVLAPGGMLLLIEETSFFPFFDLGMGLQQGFGDFDDPRRPEHPLLSRDGWMQVLGGAGFVRAATLSQPGTAEDALGFDVVVAQAPEAVTLLDTAELRKHLEQFLPSVAVPSAWIQLDELPRTANGKIDRRSLALPRSAAQDERHVYVAPRTETERTLVEIWSHAIKLDKVGVLDDFFTIGGDSLVASRVVADVRKRFGIDLQLRVLFEATTIETLAQLIDAVRPQPRVPDGFVTGDL